MSKTAPQPRSVSRLELAVVFAAGAFVCLVVGLMARAAGRADAEAVAALSHALDVVRKDPRFNLALIGFARPPLPALLYLPFCAFGPALPASGLPCPILGAICLGLGAVLLNGIAADAGMRRRWRWMLCLLFMVHPVALSLGALGGPGAILLPVLLGAAGALMRWSREESFRDLLTASLLLTAAVLTRYDAIWAALTAGVYIIWRTRREGWARTEGTLIAYALPLLYCAAVWVGASWAIMGSPWHFWRAQYSGEPVRVGFDDLASTLFALSLAAFPFTLGLLWEQLSRRHRDVALNGRPAAWLVVGTGAGSLLTPVRDTVSGPWELFLVAVVLILVVGFALTAITACNWVVGRRPLVTSLMLAAFGLIVVMYQPEVGGVSLPRTFLGAPRGKVAFSTDVSAERDAGCALAGALSGARKAYILGGPGYAVSLFCGQPSRVLLRDAGDLATLPLEAGDVLAVHESVKTDAMRALLERKCLRAVPADGLDGTWRLRRVESALKPSR